MDNSKRVSEHSLYTQKGEGFTQHFSPRTFDGLKRLFVKDKLSRLYLAHPFGSRHEIRNWELEMEDIYDIDIYNPFYDSDRQDIHDIDNGLKDRYNVDLDIVDKDYEEIRKSDGLIAIIDGNYSVGTLMELSYAFLYGKTTYVICTNGEINHIWIRYHSSYLFDSFAIFEVFCSKNVQKRTKK